MIHLPPLRLRRTKKQLIVGLVVLLLVLLGGYVVWSEQTWAQLSPRYTQWHQSIKAAIDKTMTLPTGTSSEKDAVTKALKGVSDKIVVDRQAICSVSPLIMWQKEIILAHKEVYTTCQQGLSVMSDFQKRLETVISYNNNDQSLAIIMATAAPSTDALTESGWTQQVNAWTYAITATEKMSSVTNEFKPIQQSAIMQMTAIKTAWQDLIASHEAKDKQKYLASQDALATAIDNLNEVATTSQQAFSKLTGELELASQKALAS